MKNTHDVIHVHDALEPKPCHYLPSTTATPSAVMKNFGIDHSYSSYAGKRRYDDSELYRLYQEAT